MLYFFIVQKSTSGYTAYLFSVRGLGGNIEKIPFEATGSGNINLSVLLRVRKTLGGIYADGFHRIVPVGTASLQFTLFTISGLLYHRPDSDSALLRAFFTTNRCKYQAERCKKYEKSYGNSFEHKNTHPENTILPDSSLLYHSFLFFASTDLPSAASVGQDCISDPCTIEKAPLLL